MIAASPFLHSSSCIAFVSDSREISVSREILDSRGVQLGMTTIPKEELLNDIRVETCAKAPIATEGGLRAKTAIMLFGGGEALMPVP